MKHCGGSLWDGLSRARPLTGCGDPISFFSLRRMKLPPRGLSMFIEKFGGAVAAEGI